MNMVKRILLVVVVALSVVGLSANRSAAGVLYTSPVYASLSSYHLCVAVNVSNRTLPSLKAELLSSAGTVIGTFTETDLQPGSVIAASADNSYEGYAWCRFTTGSTRSIRANISVFKTDSTIAVDAAR
jgi:hypothetical protein